MHDVSSSSSWSCTSSTGSSDGAELVNARDHEARTAEITDCDPLDATLHKARLTVACHSATPDEAAETMRMLGIHPEQAPETMRMPGIHPDQADDESYVTRAPTLPNTAGRAKGEDRMKHPVTEQDWALWLRYKRRRDQANTKTKDNSKL
jgi:hypothetical protein